MAKNVTYFDMAENDYMFLYDDFQCNWRKIINVDGYYFSARYPGEESFIVDKEDVEDC